MHGEAERDGEQAAAQPGDGRDTTPDRTTPDCTASGHAAHPPEPDAAHLEQPAPSGESAASEGAEDIMAGVLRQWHSVLPELDTGPMALIGRLNRCAALLQQAVDAPLRQAGLTRPEFDLLGTLRRVDAELTPGRLARETFASGAAVTKRLKELDSRGLVSRRPDERDRRVAHVSLTDTGRELVDRLLPDQLAYETALLAPLGADRHGRLSGDLRELLRLLEQQAGDSELPARPRV